MEDRGRTKMTVKNIDRKIAEAMPEVMQGEGKLKTKDLAKELHREGLGGKDYIKARLHINRDWFPDQDNNVETFLEDDETGGNDTRYWRLEE